MKTALMTGSTGFIGSHLVNGLLAAGWQVHVVIRKPLGECSWDPAQVKTHHHDGSTEGLVSIMREAGPDVVLHLASLFLSSHRVEDVVPLMQSNVQFPAQLLEAMHQANCGRLLNTGTAWQHYRGMDYSPVNLYAATKQAFGTILQYYVEACGLRAITLELSDTYGPGDTRRKLMHLLDEVARTQKPLPMSPGEQKIDLVHVDDVVRAYLIAAERLLAEPGNGHECYAVSSGQPVRLKELVAVFERVRGVSVPVQWGGRGYREREVMEPWSGGNILPGWSPQIGLESGLRGEYRRG
ncbi:MAG: NAD-dependent epimerase/dehydratase family protein [Gallionella sp.]